MSRLAVLRRHEELNTSRTPHCLKSLRISQGKKCGTLFVAFLAVFSVGFVSNLSSATWPLKFILLLLCYAFINLMAMFFIGVNDMANSFLICISFATKFWVYVTSVFFFWPVITLAAAKMWFFTLSTTMWYFFYKTVMSDPGIILSSGDEQKTRMIMKAEKGLDGAKFCSTCMIVKPLRSKHCAVTDRCVAKFDHYCPWVCNAVGAGNHCYFIGYLFFVFWMLLWNVWATFQYWNAMCSIPSDPTILERIALLSRCSPWVFWIFANCVFHTFWVFLPLSCQLYQILCLGVTTNERINAERYAHFKSTVHGHLQKSPFNRGILKNSADFFGCSCFGALKPIAVDWKTTMEFDSTLIHPCSKRFVESV